MSARSLLLFAAFTFGLFAPVAVPLYADEPAMPDVETAKNSFPGIVNANAVYVRCGPAESYYPTMRLDKGTKVTVVGIRMDWLKIVPPEGSFCYVAKAFVEKRGDGSVGRINKDSVNVRAGSALNNLKVVPLCQLTQGQDVQIIGEQEEYFKITPPDKAFLYVNKQFVEPDPTATPKPIEQVAVRPPAPVDPTPPAVVPGPAEVTQPSPRPVPGGTTGENSGTSQPPVAGGNPPVMPPATGGNEVGSTTIPATVAQGTAPAGTVPGVVPTTNPAEAQAQAEQLFDKTETEFAASSGKPVEQQPITEMTKAYEQLANSNSLAPTLHRVIDSRLSTLKLRADAADQISQTRAVQASLKQRATALHAEQQELEDRLVQTGISTFAAVGTLQPSSLQLGSQTLYRLTDPANGRTVVYLRSGDGKLLSYLGKFIGVKGEVATESGLSLKVIAATDVTPVATTGVPSPPTKRAEPSGPNTIAPREGFPEQKVQPAAATTSPLKGASAALIVTPPEGSLKMTFLPA